MKELVHEIKQEQVLNEIAEAAETFVAEQTGEPLAVAEAPSEPTCLISAAPDEMSRNETACSPCCIST